MGSLSECEKEGAFISLSNGDERIRATKSAKAYMSRKGVGLRGLINDLDVHHYHSPLHQKSKQLLSYLLLIGDRTWHLAELS